MSKLRMYEPDEPTQWLFESVLPWDSAGAPVPGLIWQLKSGRGQPVALLRCRQVVGCGFLMEWRSRLVLRSVSFQPA